MSIFSHALHNLVHNPGKFIKNLGSTAGHVAQVAAPVAGFMVGGPAGASAASAAANFAANALDGHNVKSGVRSAVKGAATSYGLASGGSALLNGGLGGLGASDTIAGGNVGILDKLGSFLSNPNALGWAKLGIDTVGGVAGGAADAKASEAALKEKQREFDQAYGLQAGDAAVGAQKQLDSAPLRDRVMYQLQNVLGQTPQAFKPHDVFNGGGVPQQGGYDMPKLATANAAYTPGAGGVNTEMIKKFLASLGYPVTPSMPQRGGGAPLVPPKTRFPAGAIPAGVTL